MESLVSKMPSVTVMIPVLNEADHLAAAVRSALDQEYSGEIEVILALGPSKDDTEVVAKELARQAYQQRQKQLDTILQDRVLSHGPF